MLIVDKSMKLLSGVIAFLIIAANPFFKSIVKSCHRLRSHIFSAFMKSSSNSPK